MFQAKAFHKNITRNFDVCPRKLNKDFKEQVEQKTAGWKS